MVTPTLTFRVKPEIKALIVKLAKMQNRTLTNMLETIILEYGKGIEK